MMSPNEPISISYDPVAKALHWLIAFGIIGLLAVGWTMTSLPKGSATQFTLFQLHKSVGITVMLLALFRLGWRLRHRPPPLPDHMPAWEKGAAHGGHVLLYILMIGMPFIGWIIVSASPLNLPTILYGVIPWPHLPILAELPNKKEIGHLAADAHSFLAWVIALVVAGHAGVAFKHHLFDRDNVLTRMMPSALTNFLERFRWPWS
ncbi:MAG: cytochrome b [Pseudomonadota bacterium]|nr:cytochrome b [Pseudomonadota bacterium]